jgi:hypothetical protein
VDSDSDDDVPESVERREDRMAQEINEVEVTVTDN